jgi:hypothetical protein
MALKITARRLFVAHYLVVGRERVTFYESTIGFGARRFKFWQIDCVLMSPDDRLSFQVGKEVFSIPTKPDKPKHRAAVEALLEGLRQSQTETGSPR